MAYQITYWTRDGSYSARAGDTVPDAYVTRDDNAPPANDPTDRYPVAMAVPTDLGMPVLYGYDGRWHLNAPWSEVKVR